MHKPFLASEFPFEEYYPLLNRYLVEEIRLGSKYSNPFRFASNYSTDIKETIKFFLALSDSKGLFEKMYRFECSECREINLITQDQLENFTCKECHDEDNLIHSNIFNEIKIIFRIHDDLRKELQPSLKDYSPSKNKHSNHRALGGEYPDELSLGDALGFNKIGDDTINKELQIAKALISHRLDLGLGA